MYLLFIVFALLGSGFADDNAEELIHNGEPAKDGDLPYQVGLELNSKPSVCAGSLISTTQILTAARCVNKLTVKDVTAYVGSVTFGKGMMKEPKTLIVHPDYDPKLFKNNIALIKIDPVELSKTINVISLPKEDDFLEARVSIASGWGNTASKQSDTLLQANLFVLSKEVCAKHFEKDPKTFDDPVLCTAAPNEAIGCVGDWGGPLMFNDTRELIGIMSSGPENCNPDNSSYTIYTKVFAFKDWIMKN